MNLILSFSARENGNCDSIAKYIQKDNDTIVYVRNMNILGCSNCNYECMSNICKFRDDDCYELYNSLNMYDKVFWIVPMYCGNPSSLYFKFTERCQDYFMHNENYNELQNKLYIIGVYGSKEESPYFLSIFNQWFECEEISNHILGIERHKYNQKLNDSILDVEEIREKILCFCSERKSL